MKRRNNIQACHLITGSLCFMLLMSIGCSTSRTAQKKPGTRVPPTETEKGPVVYNPATGKYEPVKDPKKLVDTVQFREDKQTEPIGATDARKTGKKALYEVALLIPFEAATHSPYTANVDAKVRRFIHYYAGAKIAMQELADRGVRISANVYDTRDSPDEAKRLLQKLDNIDVVVGPYEPESLRDAAAFSTRKKVPVFSPWTPSIPLDSDHPWFVQLTPGLDAHAEAIVDYIDGKLEDARVYLVARDDAREKSRLNLFRDAHQKNFASTIYEELIIDDASVNLANTSLGKLVQRDRATVFIVPLYSRSDEDFVNSFLRKLHAEREMGTVYVFGMPQWLTFSKLNPDYMESANVHVSTAHFMDPTDSDVLAFEKRFLEEYATLPEPAAHQGYEFMLYLGEALHDHGTGFLDIISDRLRASNDSVFDLVPVYRSPVQETQNVPNFLENHAIRIVRFKDQAYRRVE